MIPRINRPFSRPDKKKRKQRDKDNDSEKQESPKKKITIQEQAEPDSEVPFLKQKHSLSVQISAHEIKQNNKKNSINQAMIDSPTTKAIIDSINDLKQSYSKYDADHPNKIKILHLFTTAASKEYHYQVYDPLVSFIEEHYSKNNPLSPRFSTLLYHLLSSCIHIILLLNPKPKSKKKDAYLTLIDRCLVLFNHHVYSIPIDPIIAQKFLSLLLSLPNTLKENKHALFSIHYCIQILLKAQKINQKISHQLSQEIQTLVSNLKQPKPSKLKQFLTNEQSPIELLLSDIEHINRIK